MIDSSPQLDRERRRQDLDDRQLICPTEGHGLPPLMMVDPPKPWPASQVDLDRVAAALSARGPDQHRIAAVGLAWLRTLLDKNHDYGGSAWKRPYLADDLDPSDAILVRMTDKIERLARLRHAGPEVAESYRDTIGDLGAYCLLWLAQPIVGGSEPDGGSTAKPAGSKSAETGVDGVTGKH